MDKPRYLMPSPSGVLARLAQPVDDDDRRLFEYFLLAGRPIVIDMPAFAEALGQPLAAIARHVFALNRTQSISVLEDMPARLSWASNGLSGLTDDLAAMAIAGQSLLLASLDGFSVASVGWTPYEADVMATRDPGQIQQGQGEMYGMQFETHSFRLSATARVDQKNPALLSLGHRLLTACSPSLATKGMSC